MIDPHPALIAHLLACFDLDWHPPALKLSLEDHQARIEKIRCSTSSFLVHLFLPLSVQRTLCALTMISDPCITTWSLTLAIFRCRRSSRDILLHHNSCTCLPPGNGANSKKVQLHTPQVQSFSQGTCFQTRLFLMRNFLASCSGRLKKSEQLWQHAG